MKHAGTPFNIRHALQGVFSELRSSTSDAARLRPSQRRAFHDYFVTHLPSSSTAPDRDLANHHKLPRSDSKPHKGPAHRSTQLTSARDTTVVRIPLKSAKHHFGASCDRGSRPYNEDTYQAGTLEIPAFAKKQPLSLSRRPKPGDNMVGAPGMSGDPQVFYFGVFDGHGGAECSEFLRDRLHGYVEEAALLFGMQSTLHEHQEEDDEFADVIMGAQDAEGLQMSVVAGWRETVGGYFKRFKPEYFPALHKGEETTHHDNNSIETILEYAFLRADLDFTSAQAAKHTKANLEKRSKAQAPTSLDDPVLSDRPLNHEDILSNDERPASQNFRSRPPSLGSSPNLDTPIGGSTRFQGGSTASVLLISTPTAAPFWHPASPSTLIAAHVGDTRILLCRTEDGQAVPLTDNHHPSHPTESRRLTRYAGSFVADSFGEERVLGLANTRAFGDIGSKFVGVSAEPQITTVHMSPASYSFIVMISDGVSGHLEDQEIVDIVKEARTPDQASNSLVSFAVETSQSADNATALVVRLGGWERRSEGGTGSLGTKERRDYRMQEAMDPRARRQ